MDEMINEWTAMLLEKHGLTDEKELTQEIITEEIKEVKRSIDNEKIWARGAPTSESRLLHEGNIATLKAYIEKLHTIDQRNNLEDFSIKAEPAHHMPHGPGKPKRRDPQR